MNSILFIFLLECSLLWSKLWRVYFYSLDTPFHGQSLTRRARFSASVNQSSESKSRYWGWFTPAKALAWSLDCRWLLKGGTHPRCHPRKRTVPFPGAADAPCFTVWWIHEAQDFYEYYSDRIFFLLSWEGIFFDSFCCIYRHRKRDGNSAFCITVRININVLGVFFFSFLQRGPSWGKKSLVATGFTAACHSA